MSCMIAAIDALVDDLNENVGLFLPRNQDPVTFHKLCPFRKETLYNPQTDYTGIVSSLLATKKAPG
jgi:hypothetical protein